MYRSFSKRGSEDSLSTFVKFAHDNILSLISTRLRREVDHNRLVHLFVQFVQQKVLQKASIWQIIFRKKLTNAIIQYHIRSNFPTSHGFSGNLAISVFSSTPHMKVPNFFVSSFVSWTKHNERRFQSSWMSSEVTRTEWLLICSLWSLGHSIVTTFDFGITVTVLKLHQHFISDVEINLAGALQNLTHTDVCEHITYVIKRLHVFEQNRPAKQLDYDTDALLH